MREERDAEGVHLGEVGAEIELGGGANPVVEDGLALVLVQATDLGAVGYEHHVHIRVDAGDVVERERSDGPVAIIVDIPLDVGPFDERRLVGVIVDVLVDAHRVGVRSPDVKILLRAVELPRDLESDLAA